MTKHGSTQDAEEMAVAGGRVVGEPPSKRRAQEYAKPDPMIQTHKESTQEHTKPDPMTLTHKERAQEYTKPDLITHSHMCSFEVGDPFPTNEEGSDGCLHHPSDLRSVCEHPSKKFSEVFSEASPPLRGVRSEERRVGKEC